jgi:uncharacterized membrane protein YcfT
MNDGWQFEITNTILWRFWKGKGEVLQLLGKKSFVIFILHRMQSSYITSVNGETNMADKI